MFERNLLASVLILTAPVLMANDKAILPAIVNHATYVMITTYDGDLLSPRVAPADREAVSDVQKAFEKWGRYKLVYTTGEAELLVVVRTGRLVEVRVGASTGNSSPGRGRTSEQSVGVQNGDPLDTMDVFDASRGTDSSPLWRSRAADGLKAPELQLVKEFRAKVEAAGK